MNATVAAVWIAIAWVATTAAVGVIWPGPYRRRGHTGHDDQEGARR